MPKELKALTKIKLFRIDGEIELDLWISLMSMFFKANEMVLEYFDPEQFEAQWGDKVREYKELEEQRCRR